jgi:hypothetical protein
MRVMDKIGDALAAQGRLDGYRELLARHYAHIAEDAFLGSHFAVAHECLAKGGEPAARRLRSATLAGRTLTALLGLERKHRVTATIRRWRAALGRGLAAAVRSARGDGEARTTVLRVARGDPAPSAGAMAVEVPVRPLTARGRAGDGGAATRWRERM